MVWRLPRALASASSGISMEDSEVKNEEGNRRMGMTMPWIMPYCESAASVPAPWRFNPRGTSRFSVLLRKLRTKEPLRTGTAMWQICR